MFYFQRRSLWRNPVLAIIFINLIVFLVSYLFFRIISQQLYLWFLGTFGLVPAFFFSQPWTLVTNIFIHAGFGHIFGNMLTLFFFGGALNRLVGDRSFLFVYFCGGLLGSVLYLLLAPSNSVAVGASGAVFAVAGALAMLRPKLRVYLYFFIPMPLWVVVIVFMGLWSIPGFVSPDIAWQAHLGGLLFGLAAGYFYRRRERRYYHGYQGNYR